MNYEDLSDEELKHLAFSLLLKISAKERNEILEGYNVQFTAPASA